MRNLSLEMVITGQNWSQTVKWLSRVQMVLVELKISSRQLSSLQ